ncbi:NAD(P)-binding protein [Stipitochalara longipes BDJ]|nr:NAD(P)-binding protein [Stipitochalara longipes BDJ]
MVLQKAIPDGSLVLVIGAASFVGSHVVDEFLKKGYKVRATDYDTSKASWLAEEQFKSYVASGNFEFICVPDILAENAFVEVLKDVFAVIYVAAQAAKQPSVVRFVMTSSYGAAFNTIPDPDVILNATAWNETAVKLAWAPPPYNGSRIGPVYKASKVEQEKALWKFVREKKPPFVVNSVLPSWICGRLFNKAQNPSSAILVRELYNDSYVNVSDVGRIHVAAAPDPEVKSKRIYAIAKHVTWNDHLAVMRKIYPEKEFIHNLKDLGIFSGKVEDEGLGLKLLKKWGGEQGDWVPLEVGIQETLDSVP